MLYLNRVVMVLLHGGIHPDHATILYRLHHFFGKSNAVRMAGGLFQGKSPEARFYLGPSDSNLMLMAGRGQNQSFHAFGISAPITAQY